ncbi:ParA family protein [Rhodobacteraceae bacterium R_SAG1]|nr:ParA family protein [Rhodobacteraceae bacterium R_SAG1]
MSKVVTVMNMKGGVGKTTLAAHFAGIFCRYKINGRAQKILAIDYDPQFNLSQSLIPAKTFFKLEKEKKTSLSILVDDAVDLDPFQIQVPGNHTPPKVSELAYKVYAGKEGRLDVVPATLDLMFVALGQANMSVAPMEERFSKFIAEARKKYDLILIDCHPAGSVFTKTALSNSDYTIIPVAPSKFSERGIGLMLNFMNSKKVGSTSPKPVIIFNNVPRAGVSPTEAQIRANGKYSKFCLSHTLKKYKAFEDPEGGKQFVWGSKKPFSTSAFNNLIQVAAELDKTFGGK